MGQPLFNECCITFPKWWSKSGMFEYKVESEHSHKCWQVPFTPKNLSLVMKDESLPLVLRERAVVELNKIFMNRKHLIQALHYKSQAEKKGKGPHHTVFDDTIVDVPHPNPLFADMGVKVSQTVRSDKLSHFADHMRQFAPFSQQAIGAMFILNQKRCGLFYDMRAGKSHSSLLAYQIAKAQGKVDHLIIVCPKTILDVVWEPICNQQHVDAYAMVNGAAEDEIAMDQGYDAFLISFSSLWRRFGILERHLDLSRCFIILDETSKIKNAHTKRFYGCKLLTLNAPYVVLLTGTPMTQGPGDIWTQYYIINRGATFCSTFNQFEQYWVMNEGYGKYRLRYGKRVDFQIALQSRTLRYLRSECDQYSGKDKSFRYIECAPTEEQIQDTELVVSGMVRDIESGELTDINTMILVVKGFLREICCGYCKAQDESGVYNRWRHSYDSKALWIHSWAEGNPGVPAVIITEFNEHENIIMDMLNSIEETYVCLSREKDRKRAVDKFQNGDVRFILLKAVQGFGISLNREPAVKNGIGSYPSIIYASPTWSLDDWTQSNNRCIGVHNGKNINTPVYVLNVKGSIEQQIVTALRGKQSLSDVLMKDVGRKGFTSFAQSLLLDASEADDDVFDAQDLHARIVLKIAPDKRPTHKLIKRLVPEINRPHTMPSIEEIRVMHGYQYNEMQRLAAAHYLMERYDEKGKILKKKKIEVKSIMDEFVIGEDS